jgi:hypothetical protein
MPPILRELCGEGGFGWVNEHFQLAKRLLNSTPVLFDWLTGLWPNGRCRENINSGKGLGKLKSVPASLEDPTARRNCDYIEHCGACPLRKRGDAFMNSIARSTRSIDGQGCRRAAAYMFSQVA